MQAPAGLSAKAGPPGHTLADTLRGIDRDRAAEARHGGRYITEVLARVVLAHDDQRARESLTGKSGPDALRNVWRASLSPYGSTGNGADTTAGVARTHAGGQDSFGHALVGPRLMALAEAEAMMEWPVYRAALHEEAQRIASGLMIGAR